jgi:hypothetical protein
LYVDNIVVNQGNHLDIEQEVLTTCVDQTNAWLNLTAASYWGPSGVTWTSTPPGLVGIDVSATNVFVFNPSASTPGAYLVRAWANDQTNCHDSATVNVLKVEIDNTAPRDTDDIQVQHFTNSAGVFTYTAIPLQIYYTISPTNGWTPDSVELRIKNPAGSTVRTVALSTSTGQQSTNWDGKTDAGDYVPYGSNYVVEIAATVGGTTCTATNNLTVYEIRQADCVYRDCGTYEHAAVLYGYVGGNQISDITNDNKYVVMEGPGGSGTTTTNNYGDHTTWYGAYCPTGGLARSTRKAILEKAYELDVADIPYTWMAADALNFNTDPSSPAGSGWSGTVPDITAIRCDGVTEMAYEAIGVRLYGEDSWWSITNSVSNLDNHNDGWINGMTPGRQRNGAHTRNVPDALHRP